MRKGDKRQSIVILINKFLGLYCQIDLIDFFETFAKIVTYI